MYPVTIQNSSESCLQEASYQVLLLDLHSAATADSRGISRLASCRISLIRLLPALVDYVSGTESDSLLSWVEVEPSPSVARTGEMLSRVREFRTLLQVASSLLEEECSDSDAVDRFCDYLRFCVEDWMQSEVATAA